MDLKKLLLISLVITVSGCTTNMYNQPARGGTVYKPPTQASVPVEKPTESVTKAPQTSGSVIRASEVEVNRTSSAVANLLDQGWNYYQQQNYESSISVAERAMRISRQDPEVYLLLSRNYLGLWELEQAEQLARQGLALADSDDALYGQLEDTLAEVRRAR
jgi:Flp pilus assembly protein TadD